MASLYQSLPALHHISISNGSSNATKKNKKKMCVVPSGASLCVVPLNKFLICFGQKTPNAAFCATVQAAGNNPIDLPR